MIRYLGLTNFRGIEEMEVEFGEGLTLISGRNGSGKSSLLDAIAWALVDHMSGSLKGCVMRGKSGMSVRVSTDILPPITKSYRGGTTSIAVEEMKFKGLNDAYNWIYGMIGMDKHLFLNSIYLRQRQDLPFLSSTATAKETMIKMLGLDYWSVMYDRSRVKIKALESMIGSDISEEDIARTQEMIHKLETQAREFDLMSDEETLRSAWRRQSLSERLRELEDMVSNGAPNEEVGQDDLDKIQSLIAKLESRIESLISKGEKTRYQIEVFHKERICPLCRRPIDNPTELIEGLKADLSRIQQDIKRYSDRLNEARWLLTNMRERVRAKERYDNILKEIETVKKELSRLEDIPDISPDRIQEMMSLREELARLRADLENKRGELERQRRIKDDLEVLKVLKEAYSKDGIPRMILSRQLRKLELCINANLNILTSGRMRCSFNLEDLSIEVFNGNMFVPLGSLSGGERKRMMIATLFGISDFLGRGKLDFIMCDEVDSDLDPDGIQGLIDLLRSKVDLRQIIITSHRPELVGVADHVIDLGGEL